MNIGGKEFPADRMVWIRTKGGQVVEVIPSVAAAMVNGGTAELVDLAPSKKPETTKLDPARERAVAPAQNSPSRKPPKK